MKLVDKFIIICNNEKEFMENQKFLFSKGYIWCTGTKKVINKQDLYNEFYLTEERPIREKLDNNEKMFLCQGINALEFHFQFISNLSSYLKNGYSIVSNDLKLDLE